VCLVGDLEHARPGLQCVYHLAASFAKEISTAYRRSNLQNAMPASRKPPVNARVVIGTDKTPLEVSTGDEC
jgi:hypothetical protein